MLEALEQALNRDVEDEQMIRYRDAFRSAARVNSVSWVFCCNSSVSCSV